MAAARIPLEVLFAHAERTSLTLSPDGLRVAYLAPWSGAPNLWVDDLAGGRPVRLTSRTSGRIGVPRFAFDDRHIVFLQDEEGDENWHLMAVDLVDGGIRDLTPIDGISADVIALSPAVPDAVAVALNDRDVTVHDAFRISLTTGERATAAINPGSVSAPSPATRGAGWIVDGSLRVLGATCALEDGGIAIATRDDEDSPWRELWTWSLDDTRNSFVVGLSADGGDLYLVDSSQSNAGRLVAVPTRGGNVRVLLEDDVYDVEHVLVDPATKTPIVATVLRERAEAIALDPRYEVAVNALRKVGSPYVGGCDRVGQKVLAYIDADEASPSFVVCDANDGHTEVVAELWPQLASYRLAPMQPVSYKSSDGLEVPGYLTLPVDATGPVPLVVFPHGGPWGRDWWGFTADVQWLANLGYGCLQPNFRGSTGYGKQFLNAGNREWGGAMLSDVIAGAEWAVEEGIADPDRLGIYGGSFGGYMTLAAIAFRPGLFQCAIDLFGWSDLVQALESLPPYWGPRREQWYRRVGHPVHDREELWRQSPLARAGDIVTPLLVAHGANDVRVLKSASDQIVDAVRANGLECEYLVFDDEGHGFTREHNRLVFHRAAERFLAKHLGGPSNPDEAAADD